MDVDDERAWPAEAGLPALLRAARATYAAATVDALDAVGCSDIPRDGSYVISAIARTGAPLSTIILRLGVSKQAAGQLVDTLVLRGYLHREPDPADRRRLVISLTERGEEVAAAIRAAVDRVDADLLERVGPDQVAATRVALCALIDAVGTHAPPDDGR